MENDVVRALVMLIGIALLCLAAWVISGQRSMKAGVKKGREQGLVERGGLMDKLRELEALAGRLQQQLKDAGEAAEASDRANARGVSDAAHEAQLDRVQAFSNGIAEAERLSDGADGADGADLEPAAGSDGPLRTDEVSAPTPKISRLTDEGARLTDEEIAHAISLEAEDAALDEIEDRAYYPSSGQRRMGAYLEDPAPIPDDERWTPPSLLDEPVDAPEEVEEHPVDEEPLPDSLEPDVAVELPEELLDSSPSDDAVQTERVADPAKPGLPPYPGTSRANGPADNTW